MNDFDTLTKIYTCIVSFGKDTNKDKRGPKLAHLKNQMGI